MNILFPTDFSENSEVALDYAIDFIKKVNGKLTLVHVYEVAQMESVGIGSISNFSSGPSGRLQEKVEHDKLTSVNEQMRAMAKKHGLSSGDYKALAIKGNIKTEIDKLLKAEKYDLIVLGTRNSSTQRGVFFGGIANHLVSTANCPVLAVPPKATYSDIKRIVYTTDLVHEEKGVLLWLINYARLHKATLHLLHIGNDEDAYKKTMVQELVDELPYDHLTFEIVPGVDVSNVILEISNKGNVDMISMTTHTTSLFDKIFHSSFTTDVLDKINVPLIGFSEKDVIPHSFE